MMMMLCWVGIELGLDMVIIGYDDIDGVDVWMFVFMIVGV